MLIVVYYKYYYTWLCVTIIITIITYITIISIIINIIYILYVCIDIYSLFLNGDSSAGPIFNGSAAFFRRR